MGLSSWIHLVAIDVGYIDTKEGPGRSHAGELSGSGPLPLSILLGRAVFRNRPTNEGLLSCASGPLSVIPSDGAGSQPGDLLPSGKPPRGDLIMESSSTDTADCSASPASQSAAFIPLSPAERGWPHRRYSILRDVLGPDGHGPSSSHTIAPQRIALEVYQRLAGLPDAVEVHLYNSFATTGEGHRTPVAVVAGLLGLSPSDPRTPRALELAAARAFMVRFHKIEDIAEHPNTLLFEARRSGARVRLKAISIGGGNYELVDPGSALPLAA